jgi:3-oxoacyl-[acyl-carrier protein] reductase
MSYSDLKGKTFIVTGAASGMGKAISLLLAKQGSNVGLLDLRAPDALAEEIRSSGGSSLAVACNVQISKDVDAAIKTVVEYFGDLHGECNSIYFPRAMLNHAEYDLWQEPLIWLELLLQEKPRLGILG